jgi:ATP-binding cassette, subfamily B, bacterial
MARATNDVRTLNIMFSPADAHHRLVDGRHRADRLIALIGSPPAAAGAVHFLVLLGHHPRRLQPAAQAGQLAMRAVRRDERRPGRGRSRHRGRQGNVQEQQEWASSPATPASLPRLLCPQGEIQARYLPMLVFSLCLGAGFLHAMLLWRAGIDQPGPGRHLHGPVGRAALPDLHLHLLLQPGPAWASPAPGASWRLINTETELDEKAGVAEAGSTVRPIEGEVTFENVTFGYNGERPC